MRLFFARSISARLRSVTSRLRSLDRDLKSNPSLSGPGPALREFRQAVDNVRMTAWTVNELLNARESQRNPQAVISFLTAERLRRFSRMARDLSGDLVQAGASWPAQAVSDLKDSLALLRERLTMVGESK